MMVEYDHVFADVSHHRVTLGQGRRKFKSGYAAMRQDFSGPDIAKIKKRLLFGTDWHVLRRLRKFKTFQEGYVEVLKHEGFFTDPEIEDFLGGNALHFLGLLPGGRNRARLDAFYNKEHIGPPDWFKSTSNP
jgi:hypothetical protein